MDLGIAGKSALVCGASKGLGFGCAMALAQEGVHVTLVARSADTLASAAENIRSVGGGGVNFVAADITTAEGRALALAACPEPDILITNAGGPPAGDFRQFSEEDWLRAVTANMITPIMLIKAVVDGMIDRRFGRIVNITSSAVKAPLDHLALSNGARTGLTGFIAGLSRKTVEHNVTINNMLPGIFDTETYRSRTAGLAKGQNKSFEDVHRARVGAVPARRAGDPVEFGVACAYLCSAHSGYITGQNLLIDGGAYPGTF